MTAPGRLATWWSTPVGLARIAVMRTLAYLFVPVDVFLTTSWVAAKAGAPTDLYRPLRIAEVLHLPTPTAAYVVALQVVLVASALVAATGRLPRSAGSVVAVAYLLWMVLGMSWGKVDHDRYAYLVLLAVLPTVGAARWTDRRRSRAAGWAMQAVFVAVILTYFLSAVAKVRFGGWDWPTGATLTRAVLRRGTPLVDWTVAIPGFLVVVQFAMIIGEALSILLLGMRSHRQRLVLVAGLLSFHLMTYLALGIVFLPHCVAILSILPWEDFRWLHRLQDRRAGRVSVAQPAQRAPVPDGSA